MSNASNPKPEHAPQQTSSIYVNVLLPVPIPKLFTYRVPDEFSPHIQIGSRVIVPFGNRKVLTALVAKIHKEAPQNYKAKEVLDLLDTEPLIKPKQLELFQWMADYYMCYPGEVMQVALPSGLKISSQSKIQLRPDIEFLPDMYTEKEWQLIGHLEESQGMTYQEASRAIEVKNVYTIIKSLIQKNAILVYEELREKYQPKVIKKVKLSRDFLTKPELERLSKSLDPKPKQQDILMFYLEEVSVLRDWVLNEQGLEKKIINQNPKLSSSSLKTLIKNKVFVEFEETVSRFADYTIEDFPNTSLSPAQEKASQEIMHLFEEKDIVLLHGVTGSGKTEIYVDLIQKVLAGGSQVLYLLPEIALTTQIVSRLRKVFGNQMGVYHSKFSDNERVEVWQNVVQGTFSFVVGVRSSIFLPFDNLGLIIVDEEHESSYKQYDPAPRYHARDMAMVLARQQHGKVLLGSATPSAETYHRARQGMYGLVELSERYGTAQLPTIELIDLKAEKRAKTLQGHFSSTLVKQIREVLAKGEQVMLFQNRRGYSPYMSCRECAWIPKCENCDVSLTYHMYHNELRCHYCGHREEPPRTCPSCGSTHLETVGLGTEKIEDDLKLMIPEARIQRMDLDTTRKKDAYQQIIRDFENRDIDILVGTQMISKGLDFDNVSLVGIFDADRMIHFPDFRAHERAFQIMTQVSGRAGRKEKLGKVLIQTYDPQHSILGKVLRQDYYGMFHAEIEDRSYFFYPPFTRLIRLTCKHVSRDISQDAARLLANKLIEKLGKARVLGPEAGIINRIRNQYIFNILIKLEREKIDLATVKRFIYAKVEDVITSRVYKKVQIVIDVDPM